MPTWFWLMILLFIVIGFMLVNAFYWQNLKDEHKYRLERWKQRQQEGLDG